MYSGTMDADNPISKNDEIKFDCIMVQVIFEKGNKNPFATEAWLYSHAGHVSKCLLKSDKK